jgi:hypothetical protein
MQKCPFLSPLRASLLNIGTTIFISGVYFFGRRSTYFKAANLSPSLKISHLGTPLALPLIRCLVKQQSKDNELRFFLRSQKESSFEKSRARGAEKDSTSLSSLQVHLLFAAD